MKAELERNISAYFLCIAGIALLAWGCHNPNKSAETEKMGEVLISSSLLAFQAKRSPDGNTSTMQITTPPPVMPPAMEVPQLGK